MDRAPFVPLPLCSVPAVGIMLPGETSMAKSKPRKFKQLLADLKSEEAKKRTHAADLLGECGDARAVEPLIAALADAEDKVRYQAAFSLGDLRAREALAPLVQVLAQDPAPSVRASAAMALEKIRGKGALDALIAALTDPDATVRAMVCSVIGNRRRKRDRRKANRSKGIS